MIDNKTYELIIKGFMNNFEPSIYLWNGAILIAFIVVLLNKKQEKILRILSFIVVFLLWFAPNFTMRYNYFTYFNGYKDLNDKQYNVVEDYIEDVDSYSRYLYVSVNDQLYNVSMYIDVDTAYLKSISNQYVRILYAKHSRIILEMYVYDEEAKEYIDVTNRELIAKDLEELG